MVKVVNGTSDDIYIGLDDKGDKVMAMVRTLFYDNGIVVEQRGHGADWVQIKDADVNSEEVGPCRDCGEMITEEDEYLFSKELGTQWHELEEDCIRRNCVVCNRIISQGQEVQKDFAGQIRHAMSTECAQ